MARGAVFDPRQRLLPATRVHFALWNAADILNAGTPCAAIPQQASRGASPGTGVDVCREMIYSFKNTPMEPAFEVPGTFAGVSALMRSIRESKENAD
jgi:hypothetical protein